MDLLESLLIRRCARLERNRRVIFEDSLDCADVVALARRLAAELLRLLDSGPTLLLLLRARRRAERIVETRDCLGPIRHRAGRICLQNRGDRRIHLLPIERVQQRGGRVEPRLRLVIAGDWKVHLAERTAIVSMVLLLRNGERRGKNGDCHAGGRYKLGHASSMERASSAGRGGGKAWGPPAAAGDCSIARRRLL